MQLVINWKLALFSTFFFVAFLMLGIWQIERGEEKQRMIDLSEVRKERQAISLMQLDTTIGSVVGRRVELQGSWEDDSIFLLDNRVLDGKVGFEVLVPFREQAGSLALVNRGFIGMARTRTLVPDIPALKRAANGNADRAGGRIYLSRYTGPQEDFLSPFENRSGSPFIVQAASPGLIGLARKEEYYPYIIRLDAGDPNALPRHWPTVVMRPERHFGYAATWFLMAIAVVACFAAFTFLSRKTPDDPVKGVDI